MQTWEMIKELTENPDKKFKRFGDGLVVWGDGLGYLRWESGHDYINIDHEWEEVKEPVDFMTAVSSGKYIKVEHRLISYEGYDYYRRLDLLMLDLANSFSEGEFAEILENGKWYIED